MRVMIVDDEPKVRSHLRDMLEQSGRWEVAGEAGDGEEALDLLESCRPDLVITDIRMPRMDGLQLLKEIRRRGHRVGQVILSGYGDFSYTQRAMQQGIHNYLLKPVDEEQLWEALEQARAEMEHDRMLATQLQQGERARRERALVRLIHGRSPETPLPEVFCLGQDGGRLYVLDIQAEEATDYADVVDRLQDEGRVLAPLGEARLVCFSVTGDKPEQEAAYLRDSFCGDSRQVAVVYGGAVKELRSLAESYQDICRVLDSRWLLPNSTVMSTEQLPSAGESAWQGLRKWNHTALDEAIDSMAGEEILRQTERLFQVLRASSHDEGMMRALLIEAVIHTMRRVLDRGGDAEAVLGRRLNVSEVLAGRSVADMQTWYGDMCLKVARYLADMRQGRPRCVSERVMAMFREDPSRSWSLSELAGAFYMSPTYLGQVFKKETGQSVHACLTAERIALAKAALEKTDAPVYEIAERYGYQNLRSFYTAFKKSENCTPSEYRERMKKP